MSIAKTMTLILAASAYLPMGTILSANDVQEQVSQCIADVPMQANMSNGGPDQTLRVVRRPDAERADGESARPACDMEPHQRETVQTGDPVDTDLNEPLVTPEVDSDDPIELQLELLGRTLREEIRDPEWSPRAEAEITAAFKGPITRSVNAECRTSFCRIELDLQAVDGMLPEIDEFLAKMPWNEEVFFSFPVADAGLGGIATLFVARQGWTLPRWMPSGR